jgi:hypothetical protein
MKLNNISVSRFSKLNDFITFGLVAPGSGVYLAGGALRTLVDPDDTVVDYDLFFKDRETCDFLLDYFSKIKYMQKIFECPEGKLYSFKHPKLGKIQFICEEFYQDGEHVINLFDINACCFCWDGESLFTTREAIKNVNKKQITLNAVTYPVSTLKRISKYAAKGYYIGKAAEQFVEAVRFQEFFPDEWLRQYID